MWTDEKIFRNIKPNFEKLTEYGFKNSDGCFCYSSEIAGGDFKFNVYIKGDLPVQFEVIDSQTDEEYTLVSNPAAVGSFVGNVRLECEEILNGIIKNCYEPNIFKSKYSKLIFKVAKEKYGTDAEYLWEKLLNAAVLRNSNTDKWYAVLQEVKCKSLGQNKEGTAEVINLKETPDRVAELVDGKTYLPGYHMNKKHWYTVKLDGSVPIEELYKHIDKSFQLVDKK